MSSRRVLDKRRELWHSTLPEADGTEPTAGLSRPEAQEAYGLSAASGSLKSLALTVRAQG